MVAQLTYNLVHSCCSFVLDCCPLLRENGSHGPQLVTHVRIIHYCHTVISNRPSLLTFLSILSFGPQLRRLHQKKCSSGISPTYLLFNAINATEQLTICFSYIFVAEGESDFFIHNPPDEGDWLNLFQLAAFWTLSSTL
jgi:PQ loop repeat.